jgi:uncharacterized phage infection (PIP) family protein YhgE
MPISRTASLLFVVALALPVAAGCGTKVEDCNKVIGAHNAHVTEANALTMDKAEDLDKLAGILEKTSTDIAALEVKDEGVKTRAKTLADLEKNTATAVRDASASTKSMMALADKAKAVPTGAADALDQLKKITDDIDKAGADAKTKTDAMSAASDAKDKGWQEFQQYCEVAK